LFAKVLNKVRRDGIFETLRSAKINIFWFLEQQILFHAPKLLPLAFRKPRFLYLELTNNCNLNCKMCIRGGDREIGYMPYELFTRLIDEAAEIGGVSLSFHLAGESTLHPRFADYLRYALSKKTKFYKMSLTTNGTLFTEEIAKVALGLDWVTFSVDGVGEVTEMIRRGSNYETVKRNLETFLELRGKKRRPIISTNTVISSQTAEQLEEMRREWAPKGVNVNYSGCIDNTFRILDRERYMQYNPRWVKNHSKPVCYMPFANMLVTWDGDVTFCCHDLSVIGYVGNVRQNSLMDVWRNAEFKKARRGENILCRQCQKFSTAEERKLVDEEHVEIIVGQLEALPASQS
jgi:MoaA/NifB/PqqE/SkfB family radical SAM enzyme